LEANPNQVQKTIATLLISPKTEAASAEKLVQSEKRKPYTRQFTWEVLKFLS
jgi:hypothetical protein